MRSLSFIRQIADLRAEYCRIAVGQEALLKLINEAEITEQVYNSNAIENSTLTLEETEKILQKIELNRYISERELFEAKNLAQVVSVIETKAQAQELNLEMICQLHEMLLLNIRNEVAGRLRVMNEHVRVGSYIAPAPDQLKELLLKMLTAHKAFNELHIVKRLAKFHLEFEHIHPFVDGNGRIGRVLNNYLLIREGYVPINILFANRKEYYAAFQEYDQAGKTKVMESIIGRALVNSYHKRLAYLSGKKIITLAEYVRQNKLSHSNVLNKAVRQTIPAFLEKGMWKIGV